MSGLNFYQKEIAALDQLLLSFHTPTKPIKVEIGLKEIDEKCIYFVLDGRHDSHSSDISPYSGKQIKERWKKLSYNKYSTNPGLPHDYFLVRLPSQLPVL